MPWCILTHAAPHYNEAAGRVGVGTRRVRGCPLAPMFRRLAVARSGWLSDDDCLVSDVVNQHLTRGCVTTADCCVAVDLCDSCFWQWRHISWSRLQSALLLSECNGKVCFIMCKALHTALGRLVLFIDTRALIVFLVDNKLLRLVEFVTNFTKFCRSQC